MKSNHDGLKPVDIYVETATCLSDGIVNLMISKQSCLFRTEVFSSKVLF